MTDETAKPTHDENGRFVTGNNAGKGRPKGSRNKLGEAFLLDMLNDWEKHGVKTIEDVRKERPDIYLKVVASVLPKDLNVNINPLEEATDDELIQRLRDLDSVLRPFISAEGSGGDSEGTGPKTTH